jgi:hypothetical protein
MKVVVDLHSRLLFENNIVMEIKIEKPFTLYLIVVGVDKHIPSMKADVVVEVQQFGHKLECRGSFWFDCGVWDAFVKDLYGISANEANLVDMGGHFALQVAPSLGNHEIAWEMKKVDVMGGIATASFRSPIDDDARSHVTGQFMAFDRWW